MKAIGFSRFGLGHEVAEVMDLPDPGAPGPGEVVVEILASPINPSELLNFQGLYGATPPSLPSFSGGEALGRVIAVGEGVTHLGLGDWTFVLFAARGNWRERLRGSAGNMFPLPKNADPLQLAMLAVNPATAWHMLTGFVSLQPGEWVIQNAGNSGVGQNLIKLARASGWRSISLVRIEDQVAPLLAAGGDVVLVDGPDLPARVRAATGGAMPKLAIDAVAGEATRRLGNALVPGGTIVNYGLLSGRPCETDAADIVFRDISLRGFWLSRWFQRSTPAEKRAVYDHLTRLLVEGHLGVAVEATYGLDDIRAALAHAARPHRNGKILVLPNGEAALAR